MTASPEMAAMLADSVREIAQTSVTSGDSSLIEQRIQRLSGLLRQLKHDLGCSNGQSSSSNNPAALPLSDNCSIGSMMAISSGETHDDGKEHGTLKQINANGNNGASSSSLKTRKSSRRDNTECSVSIRGGSSRGGSSRGGNGRSSHNKRKHSRLQTQTRAGGHNVTQQRLVGFQESYLDIVRSTYFGHRRSSSGSNTCGNANAGASDSGSSNGNNAKALQWGDSEMQPQQWRLLPDVGFLASSLRATNPFEHWSPLEIAQFEAGMRCWGKQFGRLHRVIRSKTTREVVEFYYTWKKTSHYAAWKRDYTPL